MEPSQQFADNLKPKGEPVAVCMSCGAEFPLGTDTCPTCQVGVSLIRRCPGCGQVLSVKHANCLYCGFVFVQPAFPDAVQAPAALARMRPLRNRIAAVVVSVGAFLAVFIGATLFTRYEEQRFFLPPKIATSYALRDSTIYEEAIRSSAELGHVKQTGIVTIVGYRLAGKDLQWYQVAWQGRPGFAPSSDFAPPKVAGADGSKLLQLAIVQLRSPELVSLGREAVQYYRDKFPSSPESDQLAWILAEQTRELSLAKRNQELAREARGQYKQLASREGEIAEKARRRLRELGNSPTGAASELEKPATPAFQIENGSMYSGSPVKSGVQQITLVDRSVVAVALPALTNIIEGTVVDGHVAKTVRTGNEVMVRAGSACKVRIVQVTRDRKSALLQLVSLEIGNRRIAVSPPPAMVPITPSGQKPVTFSVAAPLLITK